MAPTVAQMNRPQRMALTLFLLAPLAVLTLLVVLIAARLDRDARRTLGTVSGARSDSVLAGADRALEHHPAGVLLIVEDRTGLRGEYERLYLSTNRDRWNPAARRLSRRPDGRWQILLTPDGSGEPLEFQFTRGDWDRVESDADGSEVARRRFPLVPSDALRPGEPYVLELVIEGFADQEYKAGGS